jgi:lipoprotein NlpI
LADLRQYLSLEPKRPERAPFLVWILRVKLNQKAAADQELNAYLASAPIGWESKIGGMLIGQIPENDFLSAANSAASPGRAQLQQKEAWYYAGMKHLLAGDNESAMADFKKCVAFPYPTEPEDTWAHAELGALK